MEDIEIIQKLKSKYSLADTSNFNIIDFVCAYGNPVDALMYLRFFWPEFIEKDGMIFLKETFENQEGWARFDEAKNYFAGNYMEIEKSFNYFEIPVQLVDKKNEIDDKEYEYIAERMKQMWDAKLKFDFPNRQFVVRVANPDVTGGEIGLIFYQV